MRFFGVIVFLAITMCGCRTDNVRLKVLIGETVIEAPGAQPIPDGIIIIAGQKIRSVGMSKDIPLPQNSDRTDLKNEWVVPTGGGRIAVGEIANLAILKRPPVGVTPANQSDVGATIQAGEWVSPGK